MELEKLYAEVTGYTSSINVGEDGDHLYTNYQEIVAISLRLQEIHNEIAYDELLGKASAEIKKFRTMILDPTIERLDRLAAFESRKITAKNIEFQLEKG